MFKENIEWDDIGSRVKAFRISIGENQRSLARILDVVQSTVAKIENGGRGLTIPDVVKFYEIFGLDIHWLLTGCEPRKENSNLGAKINYKLLCINAEKFIEIRQIENSAHKFHQTAVSA